MPVVTKTTHLKDFIGQDTWILFQLLDLPAPFLREFVKQHQLDEEQITQPFDELSILG